MCRVRVMYRRLPDLACEGSSTAAARPARLGFRLCSAAGSSCRHACGHADVLVCQDNRDYIAPIILHDERRSCVLLLNTAMLGFSCRGRDSLLPSMPGLTARQQARIALLLLSCSSRLPVVMLVPAAGCFNNIRCRGALQ